MIGSLPSLFIIFGALLCGAIVGKFVGYKVLGLVSLLFYGISGILPFWIHPSIEVVLVFRAINGLANGLLFPLANAAILRCVQDKEYRATYLGWAQSLGSGGAIILTLGGGYLGAVSGYHTFLVYSLAIICFLVVILCFKEPPTLDEVIAKNPEFQAESINAKRVSLPGLCWLFLVFFVCYQLFQSPVLMTIPLSLPPEEAGNVGLVMSLFTIGSFVIAGFTAKFIKVFGKLTASFFWVLGAIGIAIVVFSGGNLVIVAAGAFVLGLGIGVMVMCSYELSLLTTPAGMAFAAGLVMVATNLGNFLSSYWFGLLEAIFSMSNVMAIQATGAIGFLLMAVLWAVIDFGPNKKNWDKKASDSKEA
jgi:MFS family permease